MRHQFVEYIPETVDADTLYVSLDYNIAVHKCACGCGVDVVTPLSPAEWAFTYDGESISLWPSIGNWSFPCKSHYVIKNGQVRWAAKFDPAKIRAVRQRDSEDRTRLYGGSPDQLPTKPPIELTDVPKSKTIPPWQRLIRSIFGY